MTKLRNVNFGYNKFCGPAVLSILTGRNTDECAHVISQINGQYKVTGVHMSHLLQAVDKLGFDQIHVEPQGSLFRTLSSLVNQDGIYVVMIPNHFVCIEITDRKIYFCDNHTKEPMPAASSARLLQSVLSVYRIVKRPKPVIVLLPPKYETIQLVRCGYCCATAESIDKFVHYSSCEYNNRLIENRRD